ncbi:CC0125/CC1285 family lipoprotein [Pelagibius sp.]|uniref:CC0125/CC1285 family lipoprotein n=1 Tax=Pelagibius sp. TaxID=1931238 RepID=UPI003BAE540E
MQKRRTFLTVSLMPLCLAVALLAGCSHPTPYAPAIDGKGYAEQQLETDRYRVSFAGNSATPRETVENYLLYRAAEITVEAGHEHFRVIAQETETETVYRTTASNLGGFGFRSFPYYHNSGFSSFATATARPVTSYEAFANIVMVTDNAAAESDDNAYDARDVLNKLGPTVVRPDVTLEDPPKGHSASGDAG